MRSTSTICCYITNASAGQLPDIVATLPFLSMHVPLVVVFHLLGVTARDDISNMILCGCKGIMEQIVRNMLNNDLWADMSVEELFEWIGRDGSREITKERRYRYMDHIVSRWARAARILVLDSSRVRRANVRFLLPPCAARYCLIWDWRAMNRPIEGKRCTLA